jgi:TatD DNase family protein
MSCPYCIKHKASNTFAGNDLKLKKEPSTQEVIKDMKDKNFKKYTNVTFCGYGDSLIRLDEVKEISNFLKENKMAVRINTAGLANRYYGRNILPDLENFIDIISISLNGTNPKEHNELNHPMYKEEAFDEIIQFAKTAKNYIPQVVITAVENLGFDVLKVEQIANQAGVTFRLRAFL